MTPQETPVPAEAEERSLADSALERLRADILCLRLAPGEVVSERALEEAYGASRTPIRAALMRLAQDGLVVRTPRGQTIAPFDLGEIEDVFAFRAVVESASVRLVVERATVAELDRIQDGIDTGFKDFSPSTWLDVGLDFHVRLAELSGNRCYVESLRNLTTRTMRARWLAVRNAEGRRLTHEQHSGILDCVRARDADAAEAAVRRHALDVRAEVFAAIEAARPILGRRSVVGTETGGPVSARPDAAGSETGGGGAKGRAATERGFA